MVKCIAIGDPHFIESNAQNILDYIKKIKELIITHSPHFVVILGDLLHSFEKVHTLSLNLAIELIETVSKICPVYLIIGNHDYINNQQFLSKNHPFNSLKDKYNINICDEVKIETFTEGKKEYKFVFCPYTPPGRFEEALNTIDDDPSDSQWQDATCIFAHQEFYGCHYNPIMPSTDGDVWPLDYPLVISGHIHEEGFLQDNIYYPGNSIQQSFADSPDKTIALLTCGKENKMASSSPFHVTKLKLKLRQKKIYYTDIENVNSWVSEDNVQGILNIKCTLQQQKVFRKSAKFKELSDPKNSLTIIFDKPREIMIGNDETFDLDLNPGDTENNMLKILETIIKNENEWTQKAFQEFMNEIEF